jgi:hypothetical protein
MQRNIHDVPGVTIDTHTPSRLDQNICLAGLGRT